MDRQKYWKMDAIAKRAVTRCRIHQESTWCGLVVLLGCTGIGVLIFAVMAVAFPPSISAWQGIVDVLALASTAIALVLVGVFEFNSISNPNRREKWELKEYVIFALKKEGYTEKEIKEYDDMRIRGW